MSVGTKLLQAAAGNAGEAVYVDDVFATTLWNGTGANQSVVNDIDLAGEGGLLWTKRRDAAEANLLVDSARGDVASTANLSSNSTSSAYANSDFSSFNSNGFSLRYVYGSTNTNGGEYVSWAFRKQEKFFDIVTYTGTGSSHNISHNLNTTPGMVIVKRTDSTADWYVWHRNGGDYASLNGAYAYLNDTDQFRTGGGTPVFSDAGMTSTTFGLGTSAGPNASGGSYVAYLFGHNDAAYGENSDEVIIKCDSFTTDGNGDAAITLGFEPQWLLIKRTDQSNSWWIADSMRGLVAKGSGGDAYLNPDQNYAEDSTYTNYIYPTATGFEMDAWGSSGTYIYMAIRRPNKPASEFAATDLFTPTTNPNNSSAPYWTANHVIDTFWSKNTTSGGWYVGDRLRQGKELQLDSTAAEGGASNHMFDYQTGVGAGASGTNAFRYLFRRVKGFFDVVTYTGDGTSTSFSHNLGATPELKIIKIRSDAFGWLVGGSAVTGGTTDYQLYLDTNAAQANTNYWGAVDSASAFSVVASNFLSNANGQTYLAYLFATVAGISKVGSYTGTGSDLNVDCGFSAGARFVVIKRTDSTGDWYVFDSVRGIVAGNDPYYLINSNAAQVTNTDYIDPLSSGFTVTSSAPAGLNASSGTYIFLAIAQELTWQNTETGQAAK